MSVPRRIQRKRTKGWRMPEGAVYVGRPTRWGNPWSVGTGNQTLSGSMDGPRAGRFDPDDSRWYELSVASWRGLTAQLAVELYRDDLLSTLGDDDPFYDETREALRELRGRDLVCWCPLDQPCHADVLLEVANGVASGGGSGTTKET